MPPGRWLLPSANRPRVLGHRQLHLRIRAAGKSLAFGTPEETSELAKAFLLQVPTKEYPRLAELTIEHVLQPGYDYGDEYAFGLDLILDGLEKSWRAG